ncbi:hypothetical protein [Gymnodinialimonas hymeniacidonis]|uniref:hypothetical protein n=1 Tax=Gymnodinialimonas hymeniacidonis TaxID=3126508 RepID=UPI0034C6ACDE
MLLAAGPAWAQDGWWCATDGGERLSFDAGTVWFNEHTHCTADTAVELTTANGDAWDGPVSCENIYFAGRDEEGELIVQRVPVEDVTWISLTGAADGTLYLRTDPDGDDHAYLPC